MGINKLKLYQLTRQSAFIWISSGVLAALLLGIGTAVSLLNRNRLDLFQKVVSAPADAREVPVEVSAPGAEGYTEDFVLRAVLEGLESSAPFYARLMDLSFMLYCMAPAAPVELPQLDSLTPAEQAVAQRLAACYSGPDKEAAVQALEALAEGEAPRHANFALAIVLMDRRETVRAVEALNREIELYNPRHAREQLVDVYLEAGRYDLLHALAKDPDYAAFFTPKVLQDIALAQLDWPMILKTLLPASYQNTRLGILLLALFSGLVWALLLMRFSGALSAAWKWLLPALLLGALSAHAALLSLFFQKNQLGFGFGLTVYQQLLYCLLIGLREEGLKLLFFVPLIPFLKNKNDLLILTAAGLVGLGFALEENISYFDASAGLSAMARFATANFLHIALTAMCGLSLARAVYHRGEDIQHAAATFILAVAIHGFYDAFLMVPALMSFAWLSYTVFVLMGYQYFGWLKHLRDEWQEPFSITASFTYGVILVTGFSYILLAWEAGPGLALQAVVGQAVSTAIILVMFYREIPEAID